MYRTIRDSAKIQSEDLFNQSTVLISATPVTNSARNTASFIVSTSPTLFPKGQEVLNKYKEKISLDNDIEFIKSQLIRITPNISDDFNRFIKLYYSFVTTNSSYLEFIGLRSMFFLKLVFPFSKLNYSIEHPRKEAIKKFIFGSNAVLPVSTPIINNANNLYKELSQQDGSFESVKLGNTSTAYIEDLFVRIVETFASILKLREKHFKK